MVLNFLTSRTAIILAATISLGLVGYAQKGNHLSQNSTLISQAESTTLKNLETAYQKLSV